METKRFNFTDLIPLDLIDLDPNPIRKELSQELIQELIESYKVLPMGPLDVPVVKPTPNGRYQVISGNHRITALKQGGWVDAPCHVIEPITDEEEFLMKLHANIKRLNLTDLELYEALVREKEIYETCYPEAKRGQNRTSQNAHYERTENKAYASIKAKSLGIGESTVRRDVQIGNVVQEIPELKEAKATKMEAYAIARRKPEERAVVKQALQTSNNKTETLRQFTRHEPKQPEESHADYAYRHFKDALRLLRHGIDWKDVCMISRLIELVEDGTLRELSKLLEQEDRKVKQVLEEIRKESS